MIGLLFAFELEIVSGFETTLSTDQSQLALASLGCSNPLSQNLLNATTQICFRYSFVHIMHMI
jgi:hypothetical protein